MTETQFASQLHQQIAISTAPTKVGLSYTNWTSQVRG